MSPVCVRLRSLGNRASPKSVIQSAPSRIDQQVGGFDVAMKNAKAMCVVKGFGRLGTELGDVAAESSIQMYRSHVSWTQGLSCWSGTNPGFE